MMEANKETLARVFGAVVGDTPEIRKIYQIIHMAAQTTHPVLIVGEPGTGKELIARAIHSASTNSYRPFRVRKCMTLRAIDLERELTTAIECMDRSGEFKAGTLYLDQVIDLALDLQGTLLRTLERSEARRPLEGTINTIRIIASSTRDLQMAVAEGVFRRDLYFRLNALCLRVPPLRERCRDIPFLANSLLKKVSQTSARQYHLSGAALQALLNYDWPGNVRELECCLERACNRACGPVITLENLPAELRGLSEATDVAVSELRAVPLSELERRSIEDTLKVVAGDKKAAARLLGIGKTTLYRKLKQYESERQGQ